MRKLIRPARGNDRGAALALVAGSLVVLLGMAAFGSDLAWFYLNAVRAQRAADAAALGGVIWLPTDPGTANNTAVDLAFRNGYDSSLPDVEVSPQVVPGEPSQLEVTVTDVVPTFFAKILGFDTMTISRTATAEYIPPLRLGSPLKQFGNSCDPEQPDCSDPQPNFWANIHGQWTSTILGDAYSSWCANEDDDPDCGQNPIARSTGYLYGIESGDSFTVEFVDLAFHNIFNGSGCPGNGDRDTVQPPGCTSDWVRTGDRGCETWGNNELVCGPTMRVTLYAPDPTPLDISDNAQLCTADIGPLPQVPETDPYTFATPDSRPCWTQSGAGIYVLQVSVVPGTDTDRSGLNRYSVRSTTVDPMGKLFALGDFSIFDHAVGTQTQFYLAEVPPYYNGKTFVIEIYGERLGDAIQVRDPTDSPFNEGECRVYDRESSLQPWTLQQTIPAGSDCQEAVPRPVGNGRWLKFEVDLPPEYACAADCWWQIKYDYPAGVVDTTTWWPYMIGNPIHLIPSS
jgi:Flp pilus assembly protein TadG